MPGASLISNTTIQPSLKRLMGFNVSAQALAACPKTLSVWPQCQPRQPCLDPLHFNAYGRNAAGGAASREAGPARAADSMSWLPSVSGASLRRPTWSASISMLMDSDTAAGPDWGACSACAAPSRLLSSCCRPTSSSPASAAAVGAAPAGSSSGLLDEAAGAWNRLITLPAG